MKPFRTLFSLAFLSMAPLLAHESPQRKLPELTIGLAPNAIEFHVDFPLTPFVGIVLASPSGDLKHSFTGLPPLLADAVVVDWGVSKKERFSTAVSEFAFPPGMTIFVQAVTISEVGIMASEVGSFVLDATGEKGR